MFRFNKDEKYDKSYLLSLKDLPRREKIDQWLTMCHQMIIQCARNGKTKCDCNFQFYVQTGQKYKKVISEFINPITPDDLLKELLKVYINCNITYDFTNTFTIDWS